MAVLFDSKGNKLVELQGPCTNHWVIIVIPVIMYHLFEVLYKMPTWDTFYS